MHLNLTLSAPGGPGSSWGDRENPKPLGVGGWEGGALPRPQQPPVCSRLPWSLPGEPSGAMVPGLLEVSRESRREVGPCSSNKDRKAVSGPAAWTLVQFLHWVLLAPAIGEKSNALGLRGSQVWFCTVASCPFGPASQDPPNANFWRGEGALDEEKLL